MHRHLRRAHRHNRCRRRRRRTRIILCERGVDRAFRLRVAQNRDDGAVLLRLSGVVVECDRVVWRRGVCILLKRCGRRSLRGRHSAAAVGAEKKRARRGRRSASTLIVDERVVGRLLQMSLQVGWHKLDDACAQLNLKFRHCFRN